MKKITNKKESISSKIRLYLYNIKVRRCKAFNDFLFDIASKCVFKEQREKLFALEKEREDALKLKENVEDKIPKLYEAIEYSKEYMQELEKKNSLNESTIDVLSEWINQFHYSYRRGETDEIEKLFRRIGLSENVVER